MKLKMLVILGIVLIAVVFGCSGNGDDSLAVAKGFWKAMEDKDLEKAKSFVTRASANSLQINEEEEDKDVEVAFGEVTYEEDKSIIETTIRTSEEGKDLEIPLKTILVKEDGEWKVDAD